MSTNNHDTTQVQLAPLTRMEALWLLAGLDTGQIVNTQEVPTHERPGFHTVVGTEIVVRTAFGSELDPVLEAGLPVTYRAEAQSADTGAGWCATVTGTATQVTDPGERAHYQRTLPGIAAHGGNRLIRIRPQLITGHRFQNLTANTTSPDSS